MRTDQMRKTILFLAGLVAAAAMPVMAGEVEDACTDLVLDYAYYRDRPDAQAFADLFARDGELEVLGDRFVGRDAIRARLANASDGPVFRHMMSTIRIFPVDDEHATGVSYVTVYAAAGSQLPLALGEPAAVGEYHDEFVRTEGGWKIARRVFVPVLVPGQ